MNNIIKIIKKYQYYLIYILPLSLIFSYGEYRCSNKTFKDPLENKLRISPHTNHKKQWQHNELAKN